MKTFRRALTLALTATIILVFFGCSYTGRNDIGLYLTKWNESCGDIYSADVEDMLIHTSEKSDENTYYLFFPANNDCEYMLSLCENADKDICKFGICIVNNIDIEEKEIKTLFSSALSALKGFETAKCEDIFEELGLSSPETYKTYASTKKETDEYTAEIIVNEAGTGIYIF